MPSRISHKVPSVFSRSSYFSSNSYRHVSKFFPGFLSEILNSNGFFLEIYRISLFYHKISSTEFPAISPKVFHMISFPGILRASLKDTFVGFLTGFRNLEKFLSAGYFSDVVEVLFLKLLLEDFLGILLVIISGFPQEFSGDFYKSYSWEFF